MGTPHFNTGRVFPNVSFLSAERTLETDHSAKGVVGPKLLAISHDNNTCGIFEQAGCFQMREQSKDRANLYPHG
jgi:hypothetical protein